MMNLLYPGEVNSIAVVLNSAFSLDKDKSHTKLFNSRLIKQMGLFFVNIRHIHFIGTLLSLVFSFSISLFAGGIGTDIHKS